MKKILIFLWLLFLIPSIFFCQSTNFQNSNWVFGELTGLKFTANTTTPFSLSNQLNYYAREGIASVSAKNGNLLFFTDGERLWQKWAGSYTLITNQLKGGVSSTQNAIILPRPNYPNNYYIFTVDGASDYFRGIYFSEIDLSNGIGQMVILNTPLKDSNGTLINEVFHNNSEGITSTIDGNGIDFWVVTHAKNNTVSSFLTYHITENGVDLMPSFNLPTPSINFSDWVGTIKISKSNNNLNNFAFSKQFNSVTCGAYIGNFNNLNGQFSYNSTPIGNTNGTVIYGLEFTDNKLFYTTHFYQNPSYSKISYIITNPLNTSNEIILISALAVTNHFFYSLQVSDLNLNQIFCPSYELNNLSLITDGVTPTISMNSVPLNNYCYAGLPQNVPYHLNKGCTPNLYLTSTNFDVYALQVDNNQASNTIYASNYIAPTAISINKGGTSVVLLDGFYSENGSTYRAYLEPCSNNFVAGKYSNVESNTDIFDKSIFSIYPNPSNSTITISTKSSEINMLTISSFDGREVFNKRNINENSFDIDVSNFKNGIYIVTIQTDNGEIISKKLIKN